MPVLPPISGLFPCWSAHLRNPFFPLPARPLSAAVCKHFQHLLDCRHRGIAGHLVHTLAAWGHLRLLKYTDYIKSNMTHLFHIQSGFEFVFVVFLYFQWRNFQSRCLHLEKMTNMRYTTHSPYSEDPFTLPTQTHTYTHLVATLQKPKFFKLEQYLITRDPQGPPVMPKLRLFAFLPFSCIAVEYVRRQFFFSCFAPRLCPLGLPNRQTA